MEFIGDLERVFAAAIYPNRLAVAITAVAALVVLAVIGRRRGWAGSVRRHPARSTAVLVPLLAVALPLGWYLASPLVLSGSVDEPAPVVSTAASATPRASAGASAAASVAASATPSSTPTPTATPLLALAGTFTGADEFHFGRGTARLIETAPGRFVVRLEKFEVRNGPDLYVYLSPSADGYANGSLEIGKLKADKGNQNYELPAGTDVSAAASVVIWCRQFSVLFATARLGAT
jgi:hypothetical protein